MLERMIKKIDLRFVFAAIALFAAAFMTVTGDIQQVISFNDPANEIFFAFTALLGSILCLLLSGKDSK
jgi:hypothetical protein